MSAMKVQHKYSKIAVARENQLRRYSVLDTAKKSIRLTNTKPVQNAMTPAL